MGVPKVIVMRTNDDNSKEQVYPITHIEAINGLKEILEGKELTIGVKTINGQTGDVLLPILSESEYSKILTIIEAYEKGELGGNGSSVPGPKGDKGDSGDNITFTKVGEI